MKNKKVMAAVLTAVIVIAQGSYSGIKAEGAASSLSKNQAVTVAQISNINALKLGTAFNTINRSIANYEELSKEITDMENGFKQYKSVYSTLTPSMLQLYALFNSTDPANRTVVITSALQGYPPDQITAIIQQLTELNAAGTQLREAGLVDSSLKPRELTSEQQYDKIVYPREVPVVIARNMLKKAQLQKDVIYTTIDIKVKEGYDDILYGQDGYSLTESLYEKQLKDLDDLNSKYSVGIVSQVERDTGEMEVKKTKLQLDNLQRQVNNGKLQLKKSMGVDINTQYCFTDEKQVSGTLQPYDQYLSSARINRAEILAALIDIDEKQFIFNLLKGYYTSDEPKYIQAQQELLEAQTKYDETYEEIETEIQDSYLLVQQKLSNKKLADTKLQKAKVQYNSAKASYDAGVIPVSTMWGAELLVNQAEINQAKAQRDYNNALYELEQNSKAGTKYVMEGVN